MYPAIVGAIIGTAIIMEIQFKTFVELASALEILNFQLLKHKVIKVRTLEWKKTVTCVNNACKILVYLHLRIICFT